MFDIGWTELLVIGVVALIVIGPKDLPDMFRTLGRFTAKARGMARDFSRAMDDAANETGVKDVAKDLKKVTSARNMGLDAVKDAASKFESWDPMKSKSGDLPAGPIAAPKGPATQALADAQTEKRAALKDSAAAKIESASAPKAATPAKPAKAEPAKKPAAKPAAKAPAKTAAKPAAAKKPAPKAAPAKAAAAKAPRKTPAKKSDV